jgi:hypothetical protein
MYCGTSGKDIAVLVQTAKTVPLLGIAGIH